MLNIGSISNQDELLIRLDENVKEVLRRLDHSDSRTANLEVKVAALENFRYFILGGGTLLGFLGGIIGSYIIKSLAK